MKLKDIKPTDVQRALNAMEGGDIWQWFNGIKNMKKERMYIQFSLFFVQKFSKNQNSGKRYAKRYASIC